jgi:hypothetical protein
VRARLAAIALLVTSSSVGADMFSVSASAISSFHNLSSSDDFGAFTFRGGLTLESGSREFGGLSGLVIGNRCEDLLAISDQGNWFTAKLNYDEGLLSGITGGKLKPMLDSKGKQQRGKAWSDAEAIAPLNNGKIGIAYERRVRFGAYDIATKGLSAPFEAIPHPPAIDRGPENSEVESFGQLRDGRYIAIAERQRDENGNPRAWIWRGNRATSFTIERYDSYNVTDLAVMPDGSVLTMERSFTRTSLPGMVVRRFSPSAVSQGTLVKPELLLEASVPLYAIDNMEGIAVCERDGETRVTLQSDNNFNTRIQSTLLLQFAYKP